MSIIYGRRIRLRAIERSDVEKFHQWVNDPEVTAGLALYLPMSFREEEKWFEEIANRPKEEMPFAIERREKKDDWRLIGNCGIFGIDWRARSGEIGIMIGEKSVWDQGYGTESVQTLVRHGFETLNLNRLFLRVYGENRRAQRAYEKAGFVLEGCLRQAVYKHGRYDDVLIMSILRSEWNMEGRA
ncbi:MAG TPA: GNAT family protein [Anaerolineales bacterium]|nr:GNAT family protein [Anaerolineales bacterium]